MKENENNLEKAVEALKNGKVPPGPSQELNDSTLEKLSQVSEQLHGEHFEKQLEHSKRFKLINNFFRVAAAVIILIAIGYTTGRLSSPKPPDMEQIQTALEPAIREKLLEEVTQYLQSGITSSYVQVRDELTEQYRQDLRVAALEILTTSGNITNQLLQDLIYYFETEQVQDRQLIAAALEQIELNRLEDNGRFGNALFTFAVQTEEELDRTQQNMALIAKILSDRQSGNLIPNENENLDN